MGEMSFYPQEKSAKEKEIKGKKENKIDKTQKQKRNINK
jgi:hypothetical protein